jgi:hypothetical protein
LVRSWHSQRASGIGLGPCHVFEQRVQLRDKSEGGAVNPVKPITTWMAERGVGLEQLREAAALERKVLVAIVNGRYTPSPQQRQRLAAALGVDPGQIAWGHTNSVEHMYGHGPQFGRSP